MDNITQKCMYQKMDLTLLLYIGILIIVAILVICLYRAMNNNNIIDTMANVNYTPILMDKSINLFYIPNFLTSEECDHLINIAQDKFTRSGIVIGGKNSYGDTRTSHTHYYSKGEDDVIKSIEMRASLVVNKPVECIEALQIVKYEPGQEFKEHHDWFRKDYIDTINGNQRLYTFFVYLNDVNNGGNTRFPKLNLSFKPKKGSALFWQNCITHALCLDNSLHQGEQPIGETKYGLNIWVNFDPIKSS